MPKKEIWKDVFGYEGLYKVSNLGRVKSINRIVNRGYLNSPRKISEKIRIPSIDKYGYLFLRLSKNGKKKNLFVHRIVAETFIKNPNKLPVVNHFDGNKKNCSVKNLEWTTISENNKHAFKINLRKPSGGAIKYKPIAQFTIDGKLIYKYKSITEAMNITKTTNICACAKGKYKTANGFIWKYI